MKYTGMRYPYGALLLLDLGLTIMYVRMLCSLWKEAAFDVFILACFILLIFVCFSSVILYRFIRWTSYAMIQEDGIHVFSRKKEELSFIPWKSVKTCKQVWAEGKFDYLMLIFQYNATYAKRPVALYKEGLRPTYKEVWQHRMDECMDKLARGKLTEEEFRQIPYLLLAPSKNKLFEHCLKMWRAAKAEET